MNNKFKRAISSILAFVMVISVLTVMNVSTAFASNDTNSSSLTLTGNYSTFKTNWTSYQNCTVDQGSIYITYTYSPSKSECSGISYTNLNGGSNWKFDYDTSCIIFTTDGPFDITLGGGTAKKDSSGLILKAYDAEEQTESGDNLVSVNNDNSNQMDGSNISAGTYRITASKTATYYLDNLVIKVYATEAASYDDGIITYTATEGGSVKVTTTDGEITTNTKLDGGTAYTVTITPDNGYYVSSFTVGEKETELNDDNTYSGIIDGNCDISIVFSEYALPTVITENASLGSSDFASSNIGAENGTIQTSTSYPAVGTTYYFTFDGGTATLGSGDDKVNVVRVDGDTGIIFTTGDLTGKNAIITVGFATGSEGKERSITVVDSNKNAILTTAESAGTALVNSDEGTLASNTTYTIKSVSSNVYVGSVTITITEVTPIVINSDTFVKVDDDTAYAIFAVSDKQAAEYSSFNVIYDGDEDNTLLNDDEDTVYDGVDTNGDGTSAEYTAADGYYIVAYKIINSNGNTTTANEYAAKLSLSLK